MSLTIVGDNVLLEKIRVKTQYHTLVCSCKCIYFSWIKCSYNRFSNWNSFYFSHQFLFYFSHRFATELINDLATNCL